MGIEVTQFESGDDAYKSVPLKKWLWQSYISAALVPLLLIELTFLGIYWATGEFVFAKGAEAVTTLSSNALSDAADRSAQTISNRLVGVAALTDVYADETGRALATPAEVSDEEKSNYAMSPDGVFYTTKDNGGSAVFFSGFVPVGEAEKEKVWRTIRLDPLMKSIVNADPLVAQIYLNTFDSYNRIYPYFDVLDIYAPKMDIPSYNFYYEADQEHNPEGKVVWTDAYIDPAGSGWMVSAIAPVMGPEKLEAVVGSDVTLRTIVDQVLNIALPGDGFAMLVGRDGTILALPPAAEDFLDLPELLDHSYEDAILQDTFKPSEFNLFRRNDLASLAIAMQGRASGTLKLDLNQPVIASWATVNGTGWHLIAMQSEKSLLAKTSELRDTLTLITQLMLGGLVIFYSVFFGILWRRSSRMSEAVAKPLAELEQEMMEISNGRPPHGVSQHGVLEVRRAHQHLIQMAEKLAAASKAKSAFLSAMSHELRTPLNAIFGFSQLLRMSEGRSLDGERMQHVEGISRAGQDLLNLVDGVIDLASLEQGKVVENLRPLSLPHLLKSAHEGIVEAAARHDIEVTFELDHDLPSVQSDERILSRVLGHLMSNAVKYNRRGGMVKIRARRDGKGWVVAEVEDSGQGISAAAQERLFTPFERLGHENSAIPGTGIGLALSRRLTGLLGGSLTVESKEGVGTTFKLRLPTV